MKTNEAKLHVACTTLSFVSEQRQKAKQQGDVVTITNVAKYHNILASLASLLSKHETATELGDNEEKSASLWRWVYFTARIMENPVSVRYSD